MLHSPVAVWIDHNEARLFHVTASTVDTEVVVAPHAQTKLHRKLGSDSGHRASEDPSYYDAVAEALAGAPAILVLGPAIAKLELIKHLRAHHRDLATKIVGVETVDHPSDRQLAAHVRAYFKAADARTDA
jgi:stalled ribosome rescue protein Dom34